MPLRRLAAIPHCIPSIGDEGACFAALGSNRGFEARMREVDGLLESEAHRMNETFSDLTREEFYDEEAEVEKWFKSQGGVSTTNDDSDDIYDNIPQRGDHQPSASGSGASATPDDNDDEDNRVIPHLLLSGNAREEDPSGSPDDAIEEAFTHQIPPNDDSNPKGPRLDVFEFKNFFDRWQRKGSGLTKGARDEAFRLLRTPGVLDLRSIMWDSEENGKPVWSPYTHYLDSLHWISDGDNPLGAATTSNGAITDCLTLRPQEHYKPIKDKYISLPFDVTGRSFYLGEFRGYHVYILFWPKANAPPTVPCSPSGATTELQITRFLNFTARFLHGQITGIDCNDPYDDSKASWRTYFNQRSIPLEPQLVPKLNRYYRLEYRRWLEGMNEPDSFFQQHSPRTIACDYGQNAQILDGPGSSTVLAATLKSLINFNRCESIGFAIATTVRAQNNEREELPVVPWIPGFKDMFRDPHTGESPRYTVYPLAGTRTIGNYQSSEPPPFISNTIVDINKSIRLDDESTPVVGGASQGYHEAKASFRHGIHMQAMAKGHMTAWAAAKADFLNLASRASQSRIMQRMEERTPWSVFVDQLDDLSSEGSRGVRLETNYEVYRWQMKEEWWTADDLVNKIMIPLTMAYIDGFKSGGLRKAVKVLELDTFPELMLWVGAPFAFMLDYIRYLMNLEKEKGGGLSNYSVGRIEVVNMIERVLTSHQSGARKVWCMAPMKKAGLLKSYLATGFPTFDPSFLRDKKLMIPTTTLARGQDGFPVLAATVAIRYHYGLQAANQYISLSLMHHIISKALVEGQTREINERRKICRQALLECREKQPQCPDQDLAALKSQIKLQNCRSQALKEWVALDSGHFSNSSAELLMQLGTTQSANGEITTARGGFMSFKAADIARLLMRMTDPQVAVSFPAVRNGGFRSIITITHSVLQRIHAAESTNKSFVAWMEEGLAAAIVSTGFHIFPIPTNLNRQSNPSLLRWGSIEDTNKPPGFRLRAADEPKEMRMQAALKQVISRESQPWSLADPIHHQLPFVCRPDEWKAAKRTFCSPANARGDGSKEVQLVMSSLLSLFDIKKPLHHLFLLYGYMLARLKDIPILSHTISGSSGFKTPGQWQVALAQNPWIFKGDAAWPSATQWKGDVRGAEEKDVWLVSFVAGCIWFCDPVANTPVFRGPKDQIRAKLSNKRVNTHLLFKLGLLEVVRGGSRLLIGPRETDYQSFPVETLLAKNVRAIELCQKHGWYALLKEVMGVRVADMLVDEGKVRKDGGPPSGPPRLPMKRRLCDVIIRGSESESEEEVRRSDDSIATSDQYDDDDDDDKDDDKDDDDEGAHLKRKRR
ncbi:hypothetical protein BOTBODRAFT_180742 [Botryobasidium botryosum FD-172 SS1]|uniref:Uncharacterized protein n=1 Tax=Botryobasidium botryosum (strain FD-172 SS1) TaxID=930990 RepID=A0A067M746_BOTB1|nr:hypothetical protein BOTBODRAFT_180742 [Botryobasidium botryosum FD-172 SS1]